MTSFTDSGPNRREVLFGAAAAGLLAPVSASAQEGSPDLISAANREGAVVFYTAVDLAVSLKISNDFMKKYPQIHVQVERTGAERVTQRVMQEYASNIKAVDLVDSSDTSGMLDWKSRGWLAKFLPENVLRSWPEEERDPDDRFATFRAHLSIMGYNTKQVSPDSAPRSFEDLLDPKWSERIVKAHPAFSGSVLVSTFALVKILGWQFFEKLAKQRVMQVQAAVDAVKKVAQGERSVMVDGSEYDALFLKETHNPIEVVYPTEGAPLVPAWVSVMDAAPHPNAARLFASYLFSLECQQLISDEFGLRSFSPELKTKPDRKPLSEIKLLRSDPEELKEAAEEIKHRYSEVFGV